MKIGITGGTGFVGRALIDLLSDQHELRCIARDVKSATEISNQVDWIRGDLGKDDWQAGFVEGCDAIVHSGLWRSTRSFQGSESDVVEYLRINFLGSIKLMDAALRANIQRFVFVSTCAVHQRILDDRPLDETHPLWAANHYGAHKAALEKFVHSYGFGNDFSICALRPTGIYGVTRPVENSKWFELIRDISLGKDVEVSKGGKEVHVQDVAKAIKLLLESQDDISGQAYACYDQYISEFEVATIAKKLLNSKSTIIGEPKSPQHEIVTEKIRSLGMTFGGQPLLEQTIQQIITETT